MRRCMIKWLFWMIISCCPIASQALDSDKTAIVYLSAGTASLNQETHTGTYSHQVRVDQGSTHIRAHTASTSGNNKNQLVHAIIHGNQKQQAHLWTTPSPNKLPIHAYADLIHYYPLEHRVELMGHARIIQNKNSFSAPKIYYDTVKQQVTTEQQGSERTVIIYDQSQS